MVLKKTNSRWAWRLKEQQIPLKCVSVSRERITDQRDEWPPGHLSGPLTLLETRFFSRETPLRQALAPPYAPSNRTEATQTKHEGVEHTSEKRKVLWWGLHVIGKEASPEAVGIHSSPSGRRMNDWRNKLKCKNHTAFTSILRIWMVSKNNINASVLNRSYICFCMHSTTPDAPWKTTLLWSKATAPRGNTTLH